MLFKTFQLFFLPQIFVLVISFGLFNGLVFLPVLLGLVGPAASHPDEVPEPETNGAVKEDKLRPKKAAVGGEEVAEAIELKSLVA